VIALIEDRWQPRAQFAGLGLLLTRSRTLVYCC
jgi:hypothetical protein